jgi:hypothetical protein
MANYGTQTVGAVMQDIEIDVQAILITLPGGESITSTTVWLQTTNGSLADVKSVLYNVGDNTIAYQSNQLTFTDDTGGWKTITWPATTPSAGSYLLSVGAGPISGGLNTVNMAVDTVTASTNYRRASGALAGAQSTYPTFPSPITWDLADHTQNPSLYLVTAGGGGSARARKRGLRLGLRSGLREGF